MQQRKGRPSGTDGSDFSYRMVVDPRYTKVADGKSRLKALIIVQAIVQLIGALTIFLSKEKASVLSISIGFVSLLIGELGRRRSQANYLSLYTFGSFIVTLHSILGVIRSNNLLEVIQGRTNWAANNFELIEIGNVLLGGLVEIFVIITTVSLIRNMAPPKRAS